MKHLKTIVQMILMVVTLYSMYDTLRTELVHVSVAKWVSTSNLFKNDTFSL